MGPAPTDRGALLLDRATIGSLMTPADYLEATRCAFLALAQHEAQCPLPLHLETGSGGFHVKAAALGGVAAVKLNGNFPANPKRLGLPTVQGVILLLDADCGTLLAVLDSAEVTIRRTAAASAIAARSFALAGSQTLAICGCGAQALAQVEAIAAVLPIERVLGWDIDRATAEAFCGHLAERTGLACVASPTLAGATLEADVIVTCTTAQQPYLTVDHVRPGAFVAAVGADNPSKSEVDPRLLAASCVIVDSLDQCLIMGDLHHAVAAGAMTRGEVHGTLGDVLSGAIEGRSGPDECWVFDSTGVAVQDVATAEAVYRRAIAKGAGERFAFA